MSLWRQPEFLKLWAGQTISIVGSLVTQLALGLTAAALLGASPIEMGVLGLVQSVPFLLFGLPAGVWVDRVRRRPLLIWSDVGRAVLLLSVPLAAGFGLLSMAQLYVVGFGLGSLNVLFSVAYGSFLPSVVSRAHLHDGNNKLALGEAVARVTGSGLAGVLVQVLTGRGVAGRCLLVRGVGGVNRADPSARADGRAGRPSARMARGTRRHRQPRA